MTQAKELPGILAGQIRNEESAMQIVLDDALGRESL